MLTDSFGRHGFPAKKDNSPEMSEPKCLMWHFKLAKRDTKADGINFLGFIFWHEQ